MLLFNVVEKRAKLAKKTDLVLTSCWLITLIECSNTLTEQSHLITLQSVFYITDTVSNSETCASYLVYLITYVLMLSSLFTLACQG